jgi:hypothetical protein
MLQPIYELACCDGCGEEYRATALEAGEDGRHRCYLCRAGVPKRRTATTAPRTPPEQARLVAMPAPQPAPRPAWQPTMPEWLTDYDPEQRVLWTYAPGRQAAGAIISRDGPMVTIEVRKRGRRVRAKACAVVGTATVDGEQCLERFAADYGQKRGRPASQPKTPAHSRKAPLVSNKSAFVSSTH